APVATLQALLASSTLADSISTVVLNIINYHGFEKLKLKTTQNHQARPLTQEHQSEGKNQIIIT
ncbi:hypothetical protein, partial [Serratia marcescens]|uniref:hypothetical protein n=1 Tax=Serratia marcescens TaxID=615 RepID=UPI00158C5635